MGCAAGCGGSNGDPHTHPFNSDPYEFQAAGEFTLVRSTDGKFEIQARQQPWHGSADLSINSALAMRVGPVTLELDAGEDPGAAHRSPPRATALPPARSARWRQAPPAGPRPPGEGPVLEIGWTDGSRARVWPVGNFGVAVLLAPARSLTGRLTGSLWPPNADFVGRGTAAAIRQT